MRESAANAAREMGRDYYDGPRQGQDRIFLTADCFFQRGVSPQTPSIADADVFIERLHDQFVFPRFVTLELFVESAEPIGDVAKTR